MDIIENIKGSVVQHGPHNDRIYLIRLNTDDTDGLIAALDELAVKNDYGKIFAKIPAPAWDAFQRADYIKEALVPRLYAGQIDGFFIAKYYSIARQKSRPSDRPSRFTQPAEGRSQGHRGGKVERGVVACTPLDAAEMSATYRKIFSSFPFPIHDPQYLESRMKKSALYYCIRMKGQMAAVAAAEVDSGNKNAEMTDFATLPKWRSMGFAKTLLKHMEKQARKREVQTAFTIARAESDGINFVFKNSGYRYAGMLKNNTQISGSIQSMTVWYKHL